MEVNEPVAENLILTDQATQSLDSVDVMAPISTSCSAVASSTTLTSETTALVLDVSEKTIVLAEQFVDSLGLGLTVQLDCTAEDFAGNVSHSPSPPQPNIEELPVSETVPVSSAVCPSSLALAAVETSLSSSVLQRYNHCFRSKVEIPNDRIYSTWKFYKDLVDREQIESSTTLQRENQITSQTVELTAEQPSVLITQEREIASAQVFPFQNSSAPG